MASSFEKSRCFILPHVSFCPGLPYDFTSGSVLFSQTKPIFRERNAIFLEIITTSQYITWTTEADPGFLDIEFKFTKGGGGLMH